MSILGDKYLCISENQISKRKKIENWVLKEICQLLLKIPKFGEKISDSYREFVENNQENFSEEKNIFYSRSISSSKGKRISLWKSNNLKKYWRFLFHINISGKTPTVTPRGEESNRYINPAKTRIKRNSTTWIWILSTTLSTTLLNNVSSLPDLFSNCFAFVFTLHSRWGWWQAAWLAIGSPPKAHSKDFDLFLWYVSKLVSLLGDRIDICHAKNVNKKIYSE